MIGISIDHKCPEKDCPYFGQRTMPGMCGCHQSREKMLEAEVIRLRKRLAGDAQSESDEIRQLRIDNARLRDEAFLRSRGVAQAPWQEPAARWLEDKADISTNSLHCGDSSMTIHFTHKHAATLRALAKEIRASLVSSTDRAVAGTQHSCLCGVGYEPCPGPDGKPLCAVAGTDQAHTETTGE